MLPLQWHHATIHSTAAWGVATGSPTVIAAVCDGGIDLTHVDLAANIHSPGYDLIDYTPNGDVTYDPLNPTSYTHGTKVGGMIGAVGNNVEGVTGVNWNVDLLAIKVTHNVTGSASLSKLVECVDYARSRGAKVVNQSFTGVAYSSANNAAGQALQAAGGLLVVAAGNDSLNRRTEKNYPYIIVVGGTDEADVKTAFSTYGPAIDLVAPAINLVTTRPTWRPTPYVMGDAGTSFASPIVAGVAALIFAARPDLTPATVQDILFKSAQDLGAAGVDNVYGNGRVDAGAALARALTAVNPVPGPGKKK
jgi:thermitase